MPSTLPAVICKSISNARVSRNEHSREGIEGPGGKVLSTPEGPLKPDVKTRAKTNDVPVARLIGFEAKEVADGRAMVTLAAGPRHANPIGTLHGGILCGIADAAMGNGVREHACAGGILYHGGIEDQFLPASLGG
jgi:Domain of unknown function (DUF4442)